MPGSSLPGDPWQRRVSLEPFNTLRLPGRAEQYAEIRSAEQLSGLAASGQLAGRPLTLLGGGSNVVLAGDLAGRVLRICIPGRERLGGTLVRAGAGEDWPSFVLWTLEQGLGGLENLAHIPGTVGAAPVQNIGAYGLEAGDRIHRVEVVDLRDGRQRVLEGSECRFAYRESLFKLPEGRHWAVTAVTFRLPEAWRPETGYAGLDQELAARGMAAPGPRDIAEAIIAVRRRKIPDPAEIPSAGSFFKNPVLEAGAFERLKAGHSTLPAYPQADGRVKVAAGWLIEQVGWKGRALGPVAMFGKQALVLVNLGGATGAEVLRLADAVRGDVRDRFGISLEMEPVVLG
nr:UDP-N-acetylmuramate dehydrogenase [uncultured Holophaga sp.]